MDIDKWDDRFLRLAQHISTWSQDPSTCVGAVITDEKKIISIGYNGLPMGVEDTDERYVNRELKYKMIVHAERNAIIFAGTSLAECTLYTFPFMPCAQCAGMIINAGIKRVVSIESDNERWLKDFELVQEMFEEADVELVLYEPEDFEDLEEPDADSWDAPIEEIPVMDITEHEIPNVKEKRRWFTSWFK